MKEDTFENRDKSFVIASPIDEHEKFLHDKDLRTKKCTEEAVKAGFKAAAIACVVSAVPTLVAVRTIPWAKANINHVGRTLIIAGASSAAFGMTADKTLVKCARKNAQYEKMA